MSSTNPSVIVFSRAVDNTRIGSYKNGSLTLISKVFDFADLVNILIVKNSSLGSILCQNWAPKRVYKCYLLPEK